MGTGDGGLDAIVVGGGLAGLAAAERLVRAGLAVRLLEAGPRTGGVVGSQWLEAPGGRWLVESGPHSVPIGARAFAAAVERLGLGPRVVRSQAAARERHILWRGRLVALPRSPLGLVTTRLVSWRTKLHVLGERKRPFAAPPQGEPTFHELVSERFGSETAERVAGAFVRGVYAGDAAELGARSAFPRLWNGLVEHGSILGALGAARRARGRAQEPRDTLLSFVDGLGELPAAMTRFLGERVETGARVVALRQEGERCAVALANGRVLTARGLVLATPVHATMALLATLALPDDEFESARAHMAATRANGVRVVHLCLARRPEPWLAGFGFLVPPEEERECGTSLLGVLAPANVFAGRAPQGGALAACFLRLAGNVATEDAAASTARAQRELAGALGLGPDALDVARSHVVDWRAGLGGIPVYAPGHAERVAGLEHALAQALPRVALVGSYTHGVSVDDVLEHAGSAAERLAGLLAPRGSRLP